MESWLLLEKLQEQMLEETPTEADQVQLLYLIVSDEAQTGEVAARLDAGEDFQTLIDELQLDEEIVAYGGESDWSPRDVLENNFNAELADLAFSLEIGAHSQPVAIQEGVQYVIIKVTGHEVRELDQSSREQLADDAFQEWREGQQILVVRGTYRDRVPTSPP
jgi:parvulin-like peptidyl-prolyl isomerase